MDLTFLFLLLRDLCRTFRSTALIVVAVFAACADFPFHEGMLYLSVDGTLYRVPGPAAGAVGVGMFCEIVLAILCHSNRKLFELPLDGGDER